MDYCDCSRIMRDFRPLIHHPSSQMKVISELLFYTDDSSFPVNGLFAGFKIQLFIIYLGTSKFVLSSLQFMF